MSTDTLQPVCVRYAVASARDDWTLAEETMPESQPHDLTLDLLKALLLAWAARTGRNAQVVRNIAVRWDASRPKVGVDPDLAILEPRTPEGDELESVCTWREGHEAPLLGIEVVSTSHPRKDYEVAPDKYAASGTRELLVFDPKLAGPRGRGGPFRLQLWTRDADGGFTRVYAGDGPVRSPVLDAWVFAVSEGQRVRIADDREGTSWWASPVEAERVAKDAERAAKEAALARVAELEAELARGR